MGSYLALTMTLTLPYFLGAWFYRVLHASALCLLNEDRYSQYNGIFFHKDVNNNNGRRPCNGDEVNACYSGLLGFFPVQERFFL